MSILLRTMMARMAGRLIYEGVISSGDLHIATRDGEAMFFHDSIDFSAYAGTDGGSTPYRFVFTDDADKTAIAYGGAAGGGEALGSDLYAGWDFTSGWGVSSGVLILDADTFKITIAGTQYIRRDVTTAGSLYQIDFDGVTTDYPLSGDDLCFTVTQSVYTVFYAGVSGQVFTALSSINLIRLISGSVDDEATVTSLMLKKYTDVPATGLHLMSTKNGTTRNMASVETGFDPNAIVGVKIYG